MKQAGAALKAERLKQNKTLQDIANSTKISLFTLETIEGEHDEFMPPPTYARGFLKSYAEELGLDPEEIVSLYAKELSEQQKAAPALKKQKPEAHGIPGYVLPVVIGAVLLLMTGLYFGYMGRGADIPRHPAASPPEEEQAPLKELPDVQPPAVIMAPDQEASDTAADNATTTSVPASATFRVRFEAGEKCWLRFTVDEKHVFDVMLKPGDTYSVNAVQGVQVRIGNPGGLNAFFNEAPVAVPGQRGTPVNMSFPAAAHAGSAH